MDEKYICYCGLYCENCAVKAKITPAAKGLYEEMIAAGFEEVIHFIPGGADFWPFLKTLAEPGLCISCKDGGGNPDCAIRICAQEKGVEVCTLCDSYPCDAFNALYKGYPLLIDDNILLREKGMDAWAKLQDDRRAQGFTYPKE